MSARNSKWWASFKTAGALALGILTLAPGRGRADGNWLSLANSAPGSVSFMLLLSDGTVMADNNPEDIFGGFGNNWYRLTPDPNGHYVLGEWSTLSSMRYARHAFASQVLTNGMVFIAGGEHPEGGPGASSAEIYDPFNDAWTLANPPLFMMDGTQVSPQGFTPPQNQAFSDAESTMLPNGSVLIAPAAPSAGNGTLIYNPSNNSWSNGPSSVIWQAEASWVTLPDGSILTIDHDSTNSERYFPSLNKWIRDANLPVNVWANMGPKLVGEIGPGFLLPNGNAFFLGGNGHTAIYIPTGYTNNGAWIAGPDIPSGLAAADAPAAMMPNGRILCAVAPVPSGDSNGNPTFPTPTSFFEYDYSVGPVGTFTQVNGPTDTTDNIRPQDSSMLVLPDGTVLYCHIEEGNLFYSSFGSQLYVYVPIGSQVSAGAPVINSITPNPDGTFHLVGTGLTGISQGAAFGDDAQMACNYPLVMFRDTNNGHVDYGITYNWTSTGVHTGGAAQSVEVKLPAGLIPETYLVYVTSAGVTSAPVTFSFVTPTTLSLCPGDSGTLSVLTSPLPAKYQWLYDNTPLADQTNAVLDLMNVTTNQSGFYALKVSSGSGTYTSLPVQVSVGVWIIQPPPATNSATLCQPYTISLLAQGKGPLSAQWFRNGNLVVLDAHVSTNMVPQSGGGTTMTLNFSDIGYKDDGTYTAVITDNCGPVTSNPFTLRVVPNPPWVKIATTGPPPRLYAAMAYDSDRRVSVLFGGQNYSMPGVAAALGDTWEFDGTNWAQRFPSTSPPPRNQAQMVYDTLRHRTVLFGGQVYTNAQFQLALDTWEWDGTNWQQVVTPHVPPWTYVSSFAACYDSARAETLIFGGETSAGRVSQLWAYDGTDWTQKQPSGPTPIIANSPLMTFDSARNLAVLLGAGSQSISTAYPASAVWEWDGTLWHERPQSGQIIDAPNSQDVFAFDTFRNESVLYGVVYGIVDGVSSSTQPFPQGYRYLWRWNGQDWQADPPTPTLGGTALQIYSSMCFDTAHNALVLFGGEDNDSALDTNYTFEILYQDDPAVLKQPTVQVWLQGQQAQLSVLAAGAPPIAYQWQKGTVGLTDGGRISGSTSNTLTINAASPSDSGYYQVNLSNLCGLAISQPILLNVTAGPGTVAIGAAGNNGTGGGNIVITWGEGSAILQSSTNVLGPWVNVPGASSPYTGQLNLPGQFFRLLYP